MRDVFLISETKKAMMTKFHIVLGMIAKIETTRHTSKLQ